jgi:hypothetical protein
MPACLVDIGCSGNTSYNSWPDCHHGAMLDNLTAPAGAANLLRSTRHASYTRLPDKKRRNPALNVEG